MSELRAITLHIYTNNCAGRFDNSVLSSLRQRQASHDAAHTTEALRSTVRTGVLSFGACSCVLVPSLRVLWWRCCGCLTCKHLTQCSFDCFPHTHPSPLTNRPSQCTSSLQHHNKAIIIMLNLFVIFSRQGLILFARTLFQPAMKDPIGTLIRQVESTHSPVEGLGHSSIASWSCQLTCILIPFLSTATAC